MKIWLDFSNSPHPLLFAPIARRLEELDHEILVTARDHAQTVELTRAEWPSFDVVGGPSPGGRAAKARALGTRIRGLVKWARASAPDLALSHNSYAQIVAARAARVHVVTAMDYEYQPANNLAFRLAHRVVLPEVLPAGPVRRQGAARDKTRTYPGLKEELYIGEFDYDDAVVRDFGVSRGESGGASLVVARTPPTGALYHDFENNLFARAIHKIDRQPGVRCVILARNPDQREALERLQLSNCVIPSHAVDARSLMYDADLVVGGGGTMTREAALMGVPTLSVFAGRVPAADRELERQGRLHRLTASQQLEDINSRESEPISRDALRLRGQELVRDFVDAALAPSAETSQRSGA